MLTYLVNNHRLNGLGPSEVVLLQAGKLSVRTYSENKCVFLPNMGDNLND